MAAFGTFADDIKNGEFKKIYYVYGPEAYLKRYYVNELKKVFSGDDPTCPDLFIFDGKELDLRSFTDITEIFPMMSEKKLIIIKDPPLSSQLSNILRIQPTISPMTISLSSTAKRKALMKGSRISKL